MRTTLLNVNHLHSGVKVMKCIYGEVTVALYQIQRETSEQNELNLPCPDTTEYLRSAEHGLEHLVPGLWYLQNIEVLGVFV